MTWRTIWHDTDKLIEQDDATGEQRTTWTNPAAQVVAELPESLPRIETTQEAIVDALAESLGVAL